MGETRTVRVGWWAESISDGCAHYGGIESDTDMIRSLCGRTFVPLPNPWTDRAEPQQQPVDISHACQTCKAVMRR